MYLSYEDYQNMGGTLDETTFSNYEYEAECIINWYTFNRLLNETEIPQAVVRCTNALIKIAQLKYEAMMLGSQEITTVDETTTKTVVTSAAIASQSNDGVSISYNTINASDVYNSLKPFELGGEISNTIQLYLYGVKNSLGKRLLYRGVYPDE